VFATPSGQLTDAFLFSEGELVTSVTENVTPFQCLKLLVAAYFVLNIEYPRGYAGFLHFLECEIMALPRKSLRTNVAYSKMFNSYDAA
jgi:hypothetical protein